MRIGVPRETKTLEGRVALVPAAAGDLVIEIAGADVFDADERVGAAQAVLRRSVGCAAQGDVDASGGSVVVDPVVARTAIDGVVAAVATKAFETIGCCAAVGGVSSNQVVRVGRAKDIFDTSQRVRVAPVVGSNASRQVDRDA